MSQDSQKPPDSGYIPENENPFVDPLSAIGEMEAAGRKLKKFAEQMMIHSEYFEFKPLYYFALLLGILANITSLVSGAYAIYEMMLYFRNAFLAFLSGVLIMLVVEGFYSFFMFKAFKFYYSSDYRAKALGCMALLFAITSCVLNVVGSEGFFEAKDESLKTDLITQKPQVYDLDSAKKALQKELPSFQIPYDIPSIEAKQKEEIEAFKADKSNFGAGKWSNVMLGDASKRLNSLLENHRQDIAYYRAENAKSKAVFEEKTASLQQEIDLKLSQLHKANDDFAAQKVSSIKEKNEGNRGFAAVFLVVLEFIKIVCYWFVTFFMYRSSKQAVMAGTIAKPSYLVGYERNQIPYMIGGDNANIASTYIQAQMQTLQQIRRTAFQIQHYGEGFCKGCNKLLTPSELQNPDGKCTDCTGK